MQIQQLTEQPLLNLVPVLRRFTEVVRKTPKYIEILNAVTNSFIFLLKLTKLIITITNIINLVPVLIKFIGFSWNKSEFVRKTQNLLKSRMRE